MTAIRARRTAGRVVICNPHAGSGDPAELLEQVARLEAAEVRESREPGDIVHLAREAAADPSIEEIVVVGGDGSLNEALNGIAPDFRPRIALLPTGTGNDVARALSVPLEIEHALEQVITGREMRVDVVRVEHAARTRYFINASAGGFSATVNELLTGENKGTFGKLAYWLGAGKALGSVESYDLRAAIDDGEEERHEVYNFVVSNGPTIAGGLELAPQATLNDGRLDLLLVPALPFVKCAALLARLATGETAGMSDAVVRRARRVELRASPAMSFNTDGELEGRTPATYEILPGALRFVVPAEPAPAGE